MRLGEAEARRRELTAGGPASKAFEALRRERAEVLSPEWHERWAEDLEGLHDRCWELMQKLGEQRDGLADAAGDA